MAATNILADRRTYWILLAVFITAYLARITSIPLPDGISNHLSNFALTGGVFMASSYVLLVRRGFSVRSLLLWMLPLAVANIVVELFLDSATLKSRGLDVGAFNAADPLDMAAGLLALAVIAAVVSLRSVPGPQARPDDMGKV